MELFKITCVTCHAGLSVRNASIVGQIVACPKCGSMVEVAPPPPTGDSAQQPAVVEPVEVAPTVFDEATAPHPDAVSQTVTVTVAKTKLMAWSMAVLVVGSVAVGSVLIGGDPEEQNNPAVSDVSETSKLASPAVDDSPAPIAAATVELPSAGNEPTESVLPDTSTVDPVTPVAETSSSGLQAMPVEEVIEDLLTESPEPATKPVAETPRLARRFDPLDFDPESLDLQSLDEGAASDDSTENIEGEAVAQTEITSHAAEEIATSTLPIVRRGADPGIDFSKGDAREQLAQRYPGIDFKAMPLHDFLQMISQLSGAPVNVSPVQLLMAGISPRKSVALRAEDITLDEALVRVLQPLRLQHEVQGPNVVIVHRNALKTREITYPVDDLVDTVTSVEQIGEWVEQLVAPSTWSALEGAGTIEVLGDSLRIVQREPIHYQTLIFLEQLRLARGILPRSKYPVAKLVGTSPTASSLGRLDATALFTFSRETTLREVFEHWQRELDMPLLVDWKSVADLELWPQSRIVCAVNRSWHAALTDVLEPLGLGWRAAAGGAIEIAAGEQIRSKPQLELYRLRVEDEAAWTELLAELRGRFLAESRANASSADEKILVDPQGGVLLVLLPAEAQRELFVWLRERRLLAK